MGEKITKRIHDFFSGHLTSATSWLMGVDLILLLMFALCTLFPILFKAGLLIVDLILAGTLAIFYACFVSQMEDDDPARKKCKTRLMLGIVLVVAFAVSSPIRALQYNLHSGALVGVWVMALVMAIILTLVALNNEGSAKFYEVLETGFLAGLAGPKELKPGDLVLCNIKEELDAGAKDPREILPAKDRFLHMLIIGPTGCGKTSQIILPMVLQDMQNPEWGITVLEPKGDLAIKAYMMAKHYNRPALYFDPSYKNCSKFNPLSGREVDVVENIATTFKMLDPDSPQFFKDLNEQLTRNAVKVLKRLDKSEGVEGKYATLINLSRLLQNSAGQGREMVNNFSRIQAATESEAAENRDIAAWFLNDYFPERSKVYENTSGVRSQVSKLIANEYLRDVLNPDFDKGERNEINFDLHLAQGGVICISTAQGALRDLSKYLGYFLILSLQSSVFRRPGTEDTRRPHSLYIDEFQTYSTPGFSDMLTQGRSYRVSSILATQARAQMAMGGGKDGKNFVELVSSNARNIILFPGINKDDAEYYSKQFGEYEKTEIMTGISQKKFNLLTGGLDRLGHPTEQVRETKKMTANFSASDLIFAEFGEIVYCIIKKNSIQPAKKGIITYIPSDLNKELDQEVLSYSAENARESAAEFAMHEGEDVPSDAPQGDNGLVFGDAVGEYDDIPDFDAGAPIGLDQTDTQAAPPSGALVAPDQPSADILDGLDLAKIASEEEIIAWDADDSISDLPGASADDIF